MTLTVRVSRMDQRTPTADSLLLPLISSLFCNRHFLIRFWSITDRAVLSIQYLFAEYKSHSATEELKTNFFADKYTTSGYKTGSDGWSLLNSSFWEIFSRNYSIRTLELQRISYTVTERRFPIELFLLHSVVAMSYISAADKFFLHCIQQHINHNCMIQESALQFLLGHYPANEEEFSASECCWRNTEESSNCNWPSKSTTGDRPASSSI